ncbi:MAG: hypothetical protein PVF93_12250 [Chromatiaceae bacterium]|jgi:hypothetical protein
MSGTKRSSGANKPSEDFAAYCEAEFERRRNMDEPFDERLYHKAKDLVLTRLIQLEEERES